MEVVQCSMCGREFSGDAVVAIGDDAVCAECKPVYLQRLREGASLSEERTYGGFWIRVVAQLVDGLIISIGGIIVSFIFGVAFGAIGMNGIATRTVTQVLLTILGIAYVTFFLGTYGATLGKMICRLRVIRPSDDKISYGRAFVRYWATLLSGFILCIGYIMAAFDDEKRALHDRLCDTRVVRA